MIFKSTFYIIKLYPLQNIAKSKARLNVSSSIYFRYFVVNLLYGACIAFLSRTTLANIYPKTNSSRIIMVHETENIEFFQSICIAGTH